MNKYLSTLLLIASLACTPAAHAAMKVFACEPEWGALARELGGDQLDVYVATSALQDVHQIQPKPSLIARYRQADLRVCTGAELEIGWLPPLAEKGNNPRVAPGSPGDFEASRYVAMREIPATLDRANGDVHPFGNPHIQTGPQNILPIAQQLSARLAQIDAAHAAIYSQRLQAFSQRWNMALQTWKVQAQPLQGVSVVSSHRAWVYLYEWLGLHEVATLEPKPGIPPSAAHLDEVLTTLKSQPARMVIYAAYQDRRPVDWMTEHAAIPAVELPFSPGGLPGTDDLFGLYQVTLDRLLAALQPKAG